MNPVNAARVAPLAARMECAVSGSSFFVRGASERGPVCFVAAEAARAAEAFGELLILDIKQIFVERELHERSSGRSTRRTGNAKKQAPGRKNRLLHTASELRLMAYHIVLLIFVISLTCHTTTNPNQGYAGSLRDIPSTPPDMRTNRTAQHLSINHIVFTIAA